MCQHWSTFVLDDILGEKFFLIYLKLIILSYNPLILFIILHYSILITSFHYVFFIVPLEQMFYNLVSNGVFSTSISFFPLGFLSLIWTPSANRVESLIHHFIFLSSFPKGCFAVSSKISLISSPEWCGAFSSVILFNSLNLFLTPV